MKINMTLAYEQFYFEYFCLADSEDRNAYDSTAGNINPILPELLFCDYIIPELKRIYHVRDLHIRTVLLSYFECYVGLFDKTTLQIEILPQVWIIHMYIVFI